MTDSTDTTSSRHAVLIGASGGIGAALADALAARGRIVHAFARSFAGDCHIDLTDEASIVAAAVRVADVDIAEIIIATGHLHDAQAGPEKSWRDLDPDRLAQAFAINATGPALVAKHFLALLPRDRRGVFAALSARVGSISDNRLGGWYGYRASKAALNQIVRTLALDLARNRPDAICVALHPGTVDTTLSAPFLANVPDGKLFTAAVSADYLLGVLDRLTPVDTGRIFAWDGAEILP